MKDISGKFLLRLIKLVEHAVYLIEAQARGKIADDFPRRLGNRKYEIFLFLQFAHQVARVAVDAALFKIEHFLRRCKKIRVRDAFDMLLESDDHAPDIRLIIPAAVKPVLLLALI